MIRDRRLATAFVGFYAFLSLLIMSPLLASGLRRSTVWPEGDASISIWANGFVAHFWTWNSSPLFSSGVFAPHGINLLANTTAWGLALLLAPVTWIVGPVASFNVELFLLPVVSAVAMQWSLRRLVPSPIARGIAGLIWGFSPFAMEALYWGWPNFLYLATPPLLLWVSSELIRGELTARRLGIFTGVMMSLQLLIGGEVAAMCLVVMSMVVLVTALWSLRQRRLPGDLTLARLGRFVGWTSLAGAPVGLSAALFALAGPAHLQSWVWPEAVFKISVPVSSLWSDPVASGAFHPGWEPVYPSHFYFGPILLVAVVVSALATRRALGWVSLALAAMGVWLIRGVRAPLHPFAVLWRLPVVHNIVVGRYVLITWFAAAIAMALGVESLLRTLRKRHVGARTSLGLVGALSALVLAAPALAIFHAGPWHSQTPRVDRGLTWVAHHEPATPVVVAFPFNESSAAMIQQVDQQLKIRLLGGWGPQPGYDPSEISADTTLVFLSELRTHQPTETQLREIATFFAAHEVTDLVIPRRVATPLERGYLQPYQIVAAFSEIYGAPRVVAGEWHWDLRHAPELGTPLVLAPKRWEYCAWGIGRVNPAAVPGCVLDSKR